MGKSRFMAQVMVLGPFLFFGAAPGEAMPSPEGFRVAKHTKAERPRLHIVPKGQFGKIGSIDEEIAMLVGRLARG